MKEPFAAVSHDEWRARVEAELGDKDFERALVTHSLEGLSIQPLYSGEEPVSPRTELIDGSGFPCLWPYTRGSRAVPSGERSWRICQLQDDPDPAGLRQSIEADLAGGVDALWLRLDRAARLGLDGDAEAAGEHIGVEGATIYTAADLEAAFDSADLDGVAFDLDAGANALPVAALCLAVMAERGLEPKGLEVTFGADPLGALARDGELPGSLSSLEEEMATLAAYCQSRLPRSRAIAVSTLPYHDAGAHTVQELAYALATGVHYLRRLEKAGVEPQTAVEQVVFRFAIGRHLFTEIAKLRAARLLWARMAGACGLEESSPARIHATTSARTKTKRDPWNNILRATTQVFAAIAGGADAITNSSFDAALGRPGADGRRLARNTQTILAEEAHLGRVLDPAGGSFYVEWLTVELARSAWTLFQEIESGGGMVESLGSGLIAEQVEKSWRQRRERLEEGIDAITGVTDFAPTGEESLSRPDRRPAAVTAAAARRLAERRERRGALEVEVAESGVERVETCIEAAARGATVGELTTALERGGDSLKITRFPLRRDSEPFEDQT
jgi:methylmalonyl-CoA mutase